MASDLKETPLHRVHEELGAKMVPFAGYRMPVAYGSIVDEHRAVRERVGIFDVSHMGEFELEGPRALEAVQRVTVNDASALEVDQAQYSAMCREHGGILDDCVVYRMAEERYMIVVNASNVEKDRAHVLAHLPEDGVELRDRSDEIALLAVQGPRAAEVVAPLADVDVEDLRFYWKRDGRVAGVETVISRTGYTGEDGFELYVDAGDAAKLWRALLEKGEAHGLIPSGLGARDSLRLEVGYALYGNDLDEEHTPLEAGLGWITKLDKGEFVGREALRRQKEEGVERKLVGLRLRERGFPRPGYDVVVDGERVGHVTSGTVSPTLGEGVAMAWVDARHAAPGTEVGIDIRGKAVPAVVQRPPFYTEGSIRRG